MTKMSDVVVKSTEGIRSKQKVYAYDRKYTLGSIYYSFFKKRWVYGAPLKHPECIRRIPAYTLHSIPEGDDYLQY